jgi:hypothetical protein
MVVNRNSAQRRRRMDGVFLGCVVLALVFGTAAAAKIQGFNNFESTLIASLLVPQGWTRFGAVLIVTLEVVLTLGLFIPTLRKSSLQILAAMVSVFIGYSLWRGLQHIPIPCHCFGALFTMSPLQSVLLNLGLVSLIAWLLACLEEKRRVAVIHP